MTIRETSDFSIHAEGREMIYQDRFWWITCDSSQPDDSCGSYGAATISLVEQVIRDHGWQSADGWHQCPRHPTNPPETETT